MKHIGMFKGQRVILLGYNKADDTIAILNAAFLTESEREWLEDIISSDFAQRHNFLFKALTREYHSSGTNGWMWCVAKMTTRLPAYEVQILDMEQANVWRGTGGISAIDRNAARDARAAGIELEPGRHTGKPAPQAAPQAAQNLPVPAPQNDALVAALNSLVSTMSQINSRLAQVEKVVKVDERLKREEKRRGVVKRIAPAPAPKAATSAAA